MLGYAKSTVPFRNAYLLPGWVYETLEMLKEVEDTVSVSQRGLPTSATPGKGLPSNFVASADSVMSVSPTLSQGCRKAFMGVVWLNNVKASNPLPSDFFEEVLSDQFAANYILILLFHRYLPQGKQQG
ncbi:hypothetical protein BDZ89DRAFT_1126621 [Hymenopellis radicata]|nr:hypothetical protein BDZ89DRAFT_1126621 [Hymenopellis radicata]